MKALEGAERRTTVAPLPQNTTNRVFFDYVTGSQATSQEHTVAIRAFGPGTTTDDVQNRFRTFLAAIGATNFPGGWKVVRVRYQTAGTTFSVPLALTSTLATFVGTGGNLDPFQEARELTWQGRSFTTGRRLDFSIYGILLTTPNNFRLVPGAGAPSWVASSVGALAGNPEGIWTTIDNSQPTWYNYVNVNYNSYWEARIRSV